ncbi:hypothetical protein [Paraliomyxa miuraensis]|uniref:hypothetical protein n=1 Tax=Paraliomyxa miuraensis TaxID=376150 RepID=UPI0022555545|nr:hypothetical protein [Paraliomyxa miuraensis]MCX4243920.1 hypothetical protein [Paraliomyxa miuraensis]
MVTDEFALEELMGLLEWSLSVGYGGEAGLRAARCVAQFESQLDEYCAWEIEAVLRRRSEDQETGEIVYARVELIRGVDQPACRALASCSTEVWADRGPVPMPAHLGAELPFSQSGRNSYWDPSKGSDIGAHYRRLVVDERRDLEELEAAAHEPTQVTPSSLGWNLLFLRHHLDEFDCVLDVLEQREEACGT